MKVRSNITYTATQYNKPGDHPDEYIWSVAVPIICENPFTLGTLADCKPENLRYAIMQIEDKYGPRGLEVKFGWWVLHNEKGEPVKTMSNEDFLKNYVEEK